MKRLQILDVYFFAIPFAVGMVYLLAFYPGILTYDSIFQWDQLSRFEFNNWHPAYHTFLIWLLTRVKYSPVVLPLFQIAAFSAVMAYGLRAFKDLGVPAWLLIALDAAVSITPINGMMLVTLWKDVLFGIAVLLLTVYLLKIVVSRGAWLACPWNWLYLGLTAANVALLRHNGFPVALGTLVAVLAVYTRRRGAIQALAAAVLFAGLVNGPLYWLLRVDMNNTQPSGVILIHPLAAHVNSGASFSDEETAFLNRLYPLENGWPYSCYDATVFFYRGVNFQPVQEDALYAARLLGRLTLASPLVTVKHFACLSSFVWQPAQPEGVLLETIYTANQDLAALPDWQPYAPYIDQRPKLPAARELIINVMERAAQLDPGKVGWRPAIYLYLFTAAVAFYALRKGQWSALLLLAPALLQTVIIALSLHLQALRYQYPVYLLAMVFVLPLVYLGARGWRGMERE